MDDNHSDDIESLFTEETSLKEFQNRIKDLLKHLEKSQGIDAKLIAVKSHHSVDEVLHKIIKKISEPPTLENKIQKCLPCLEDAFAEISFRSGGDMLGDTGHLCLRIFNECAMIDKENNNLDMTHRLLVTLIKFCELVGLSDSEEFQDSYIRDILNGKSLKNYE